MGRPGGGINHIVKWNRGFRQYALRRVKVQEGSRRAFSACSLNLVVHSARGRALWCGQLGGGALGGHGTLLGVCSTCVQVPPRALFASPAVTPTLPGVLSIRASPKQAERARKRATQGWCTIAPFRVAVPLRVVACYQQVMPNARRRAGMA